MKSLKKEIIENLDNSAKTIKQLTSLTKHQHRIGLAIREMIDDGILQELPWEWQGTTNSVPRYFVVPEKKNPDRCQSGVGEGYHKERT